MFYLYNINVYGNGTRTIVGNNKLIMKLSIRYLSLYYIVQPRKLRGDLGLVFTTVQHYSWGRHFGSHVWIVSARTAQITVAVLLPCDNVT